MITQVTIKTTPYWKVEVTKILKTGKDKPETEIVVVPEDTVSVFHVYDLMDLYITELKGDSV